MFRGLGLLALMVPEGMARGASTGIAMCGRASSGGTSQSSAGRRHNYRPPRLASLLPLICGQAFFERRAKK
jgi:hypothetical protein